MKEVINGDKRGGGERKVGGLKYGIFVVMPFLNGPLWLKWSVFDYLIISGSLR